MNIEEKVKKIVELLEPCLKKEKGYYSTAYGKKTEEGLIASIKAILEEQ